MRCTGRVCGRSLTGNVGSIPAGGVDVCLLWVFWFLQVEVSVRSLSIFQKSPTECGVSKCDDEFSIMRTPWPAGGCCSLGGGGPLVAELSS